MTDPTYATARAVFNADHEGRTQLTVRDNTGTDLLPTVRLQPGDNTLDRIAAVLHRNGWRVVAVPGQPLWRRTGSDPFTIFEATVEEAR